MLCIMFPPYRADKELEDSNGDDGWRFDGTVRHLPQGVVRGENGPVPDEKMPIPVSVPVPDLTEQQPSRSSLAAPSSPKTIPSHQGQQQQQQNNHIEQQQVKCFVWLH